MNRREYGVGLVIEAATDAMDAGLYTASDDADAREGLRLAEAAPQLLESLEAVLCQFLQRGVLMDDRHPDRIAVQMARLAIAKATGGPA